MNILKETCPNCESAWTGGHPNPDEITFCLICGKGPPMWIWRLPRFIRNAITRLRLEAWQAGHDRQRAIERRVER